MSQGQDVEVKVRWSEAKQVTQLVDAVPEQVKHE